MSSFQLSSIKIKNILCIYLEMRRKDHKELTFSKKPKNRKQFFFKSFSFHYSSLLFKKDASVQEQPFLCLSTGSTQLNHFPLPLFPFHCHQLLHSHKGINFISFQYTGCNSAKPFSRKGNWIEWNMKKAFYLKVLVKELVQYVLMATETRIVSSNPLWIIQCAQNSKWERHDVII